MQILAATPGMIIPLMVVEWNDEVGAANAMKDERQFLQIVIESTPYRALLDPAAMVTLVGRKVADRFRDRLQGSGTHIRTIIGQTWAVEGLLRLSLDVARVSGTLIARATAIPCHDVVLGIDFCKEFEIETSWKSGQWRSRDGPWTEFYREESPGAQRCIFAEYAGLSELNNTERDIVEQLVARLLPDRDEEFGCTTLTTHTINVQGAAPIKHRPRRLSPKMWQVAVDEVAKMRELGVIEKSWSEWSSAPVIVTKQDKTYRFCVDYRALNRVTKKDAYPSQNLDRILDKLRLARYITKIDLKQAYFQIPMAEESKKYTAFAVPESGLWQFRRMPFGLTNAPQTFQRLIDQLFGPELEPFVFGYLDDIIIVTEGFEEHLKWVEVVVTRLVVAGLTVNRKKCEFCCYQVAYLGYLLDRDGLHSNPER